MLLVPVNYAKPKVDGVGVRPDKSRENSPTVVAGERDL